MSSETDLLPHDFLPETLVDLPLIRIAADLSAMAWKQMIEWRSSLGAHLDATVVDTKTSPNDLVTRADAQIESLVRGYLAKVRPADQMVGEEDAPAIDPAQFFDAEFLQGLNCFDPSAGDFAEDSDEGPRLEWHVDPIDGTVNYVRNIEHYAFSVGVCEAAGAAAAGVDESPAADGSPAGSNAASADGSPGVGEGRWLIGLVASPGLGATWLAAAGQGAYRVEGRLSDHVPAAEAASVAEASPAAEAASANVPARRLRGTPAGLSGRLLATGFAYVGDNREPQLAKLHVLMEGYDDIRRCGSAAIDLCMLAEGKVNSYAERGIGIYDYAGGALVAEEAGAHVRRGGSGGATAAAESAQEVERLIRAI